MKRIYRRDLPRSAQADLALLQVEVISERDPKQAAAQRWDTKPKPLFEIVRATLKEMASGRVRCMYCEDNRGTDIEHFWPKADYPERAFTWANYLLACSHCNSNLKREQFPLDEHGAPLLIDPSVDEPTDHLQLSLKTGLFAYRTAKGKTSIEVFDLNSAGRGDGSLPVGRQDTYRKLRLLLQDLDRHAGGAEAAEVRGTIQREPFSSVLVWMLRVAATPDGRLLLGDAIVDILERHQVDRW